MSTFSTLTTDSQMFSTDESSYSNSLSNEPLVNLITVCRNEFCNFYNNFRKLIGKKRKRSASESSKDTSHTHKQMRLNTKQMGGGDFRHVQFDDITRNKEDRIRSWIQKEKRNGGHYDHTPIPVYNPNCIFCSPDDDH